MRAKVLILGKKRLTLAMVLREFRKKSPIHSYYARKVDNNLAVWNLFRKFAPNIYRQRMKLKEI